MSMRRSSDTNLQDHNMNVLTVSRGCAKPKYKNKRQQLAHLANSRWDINNDNEGTNEQMSHAENSGSASNKVRRLPRTT